MCVEPCKLPDGQEVGCRYCWQCRANRVNDLVGRCIAEQTSSAASYAVTLTYAGNGPETAMLRYRDVQLMLKLIRRKGFSVRYIVTGEFGSKKGRAHWHAVLFFSCVGPTGPMPIPRHGDGAWDIRIGQNMHWHPWPHGFAFFQEPDYGGFAYVLKYVLKDMDADVSKGHLAMSKKPPLGHDFFMDLADRHIQQGIAPRDLFYSFANVFDAKRKRRRFLIQGTTRANYLSYFLEQWAVAFDTPCPVNEELTAYWDKLAREELAESRSDAYFLQHKSQWPVYKRPDAESDASEWARQMRYDDPASWSSYTVSLPSRFVAQLPEHMQGLVDGERLRLELLDENDGYLAFFCENKPEVSWLVNPNEAPTWREWLNSL